MTFAVDAQSGIIVRPATTSDLVRVGEIWAANQEPHSWSGSPTVPSLYYHELATQELFVAERGGMVLGFAAVVTRGSVSFLADLFVDPDCQSGGVGGGLLRYVLPRDDRLCCTLSSDDPRALSLYVRSGLAPYWPCFQLRGRPVAGWKPSSAAPEVVEAKVGDPDLLEWDRVIGGRARPQDHAYWVEKRAAVPLWFVRDGRRIGYGYVQMHSDDCWTPLRQRLSVPSARRRRTTLRRASRPPCIGRPTELQRCGSPCQDLIRRSGCC